MATKEVNKVAMDLNCPMCCQVFKNPKFLPCHHCYCEECLQKIVKHSKITCPECRMVAMISAGEVKELPGNFHINCLMDKLLKCKVEGDEVRHTCDNCDEDYPAVTFCCDCSLLFCHVCNENHKCTRTCHDIVTLTDMKSMNDHSGDECDAGTVIPSKRHSTLKVATASVEDMQMFTKLGQAQDNIEKIIKMITQRGEEVYKEIDQHYDELFQKLDEQSNQTKQQSHDAVTQKDKALRKQLNELEHVQADLETLIMKQLKCSVEESSDQEVLSAIWQVIDRIKQLSVKYKELNTEPVYSSTMEFVVTKQPFPQFSQLFTNIDTYIIVPSPIPEKVESQNIPTAITSRCVNQVSVQLESIIREVTAVQVTNNNIVVPYTSRNIGNLMCKKHNLTPNKFLFYCKICRELVCMYCTVEDHAGHEHDNVELMASKYRSKLKELTAPVEEMFTDLSQAHDNMEKMIKMIPQRGEEVDNEIDQQYRELHLKLRKQRDQTKQQARDAVTQKIQTLEKQLKERKDAQKTLFVNDLKHSIENPDQEVLSAERQVIGNMAQLSAKCKELITEPVQSATMEFVTNKQSFPLFGQLFTNIDPAACEIANFPNPILFRKKTEFTIITKYYNGHHCSRGGSHVSVQLESNSGEVTAIQVRDNNDGSYVASFVSQYIGKVKISVSTNGWQIKGSPYSVNSAQAQ